MKTNSLAVVSARSLALALLVCLAGWPAGAAVFDDFESYAVGSNLHGQGGWAGWAGNPGAGALVATNFAFSPTRAVNSTGVTDLVRPFSAVTNGQWVFKVMQYIPATSSGTNYVILLNRYQPPFTAAELNWSVQIQNNLDTGQIISDLGTGASRPLVKNQWVEIRVEINLAANTVAEFYNGQLLSTHVWQDGSGLNELQALNFFADNSDPVYYDNVNLSPAPTPGTALQLDFTVPSSFNESNRQAVLEWNAEPEKTYLVQSADDLSPGTQWKTEEPVRSSGNGPIRWTAPEVLRSQKYYRLILPQPEVFSVEPVFVNSEDPTALLYIIGQCLPTNGSVVINGQNFTPTLVDTNGGWVAISLTGLPPGTPIFGNIVVLNNASNVVATLPLQTPVLYGTEMTAEQLQGPPTEPPASPDALLGAWLSKRGYDYYKARSDLNAAGLQNNPFFVDNSSAGEIPRSSRRGYDYYKANSDLNAAGLHSNPYFQGNQNAGAMPQGKLSSGAIVGIAVGSVVGIADSGFGGADDSGGAQVVEGKKGLNAVNVKLARTACGSATAAGIAGGVVAGIVVAARSSGELQSEEIDFAIPGRGLDFAWTRTYRSRTEATTAQGAGWDFSYNVSATPQPDGTVVLRPGNGRADTFYPDGTNGWTRDEYFLVIRDVDQDGSPDEVVFPDGGKWTLHPPGPAFAGKLAQVVDRNNNAIRCEYDNDTGRLLRVVDTLDRTNTVAYTSKGLIESVTDFSGRTVRYEYDSGADLVACISPAVIGTPNGNDFPGGKTNRYAYSSGNLDQRLNHNLVSITDPKGQTCLQVVYQATTNPTSPDFDAVSSLLRGIEKAQIKRGMVIVKPNSPARMRAIVNDGVGNVCEYDYDSRQRLVELREFTGRANPALPTTATENRPTGKLRPEDPDYFTTQFEWNPDSLCTRAVAPRGDSVEMVYERAFNQNSARSNRRHAGDLRILREVAGRDQDDDGDGLADTLVSTFEYDPRFGSPATVSGKKLYVGNLPFMESARGPRQTTSLDGTYSDSPGRGRKGWYGTIKGNPSAKVITDRDTGRSKGFGFVIATTDPRGNSSTSDYDPQGNTRRITFKAKEGASLARTFDFGYNSFGQVTTITNAADANGQRRVDTFSYYGGGPQAGYLKACIVDAGGLALATGFEWDARGNVTRCVDPRGNDTLFTYNALDELVRCESSTNLTARCATDFSYDANGNVVECVTQLRDETDAFVRSVSSRHEYDFLDRCSSVAEQVSASQFVTNKFFYDANDNVVAVHSPLAVSGGDPNNIVTYQYDERDLLLRAIAAPGSGNSATNEYAYDGNGNRVRVLRGPDYLRVTSCSYDGFNRPATITDAMSNVVTYAYDRNDNLVYQRVDAEPNDGPGNAGNRRYSETRWQYDALDRCVQASTAFFDPATQSPIHDGAAVTTFAYAPNGQLVSVTDDLGRVTTFGYDTAGRHISTTRAGAKSVTAVFRDAAGNVTNVTQTDTSDLGGPLQVFSRTNRYDSWNRLVQTVDNVGNTNRSAYDSLNNLVSAVDARGNETVFAYDDLSRPVQTTCYEGKERGITINTSHVEYNVNGRCVASTDANTNSTFYAYDSRNRLIQTTEADGTQSSLVWSPRSNLILQQDANGTVISNSYDRLDRCVRRDIAPGPGVAATTTFETFAYDGLSQLVAATNDTTHNEFAYDSMGRKTRGISGGIGALTRVYDGVGNCLAMTYPSGRVVTYAYDALDQVTNMSSGAGGLPPTTLATFEYEGPGRVGRIGRANNVNTRVQWDGLVNPPNATGDFGWGQVKGLNHQVAFGGAVIDQRRATYDPQQNKTLRAQTVPFYQGGDRTTNVFEYDPVDRLSRAINTKGTGSILRTYVLDGVGNRQLVISNGVAEPYLMVATIPPADFQMNQYTLTPFVVAPEQYDANGNLIERTTASTQRQYVYDYADRLVAVNDLSGGLPAPLATYNYDALGRRSSKAIYPSGLPPVTTEFVYDWRDDDSDGDIIEERVNGTLRRSYAVPHVFEQNGRVMFTDAGETFFFLCDELDNTLALVAASGAVVERCDYDDYGLPIFLSTDGLPTGETESGVGNPFLFHGLEWDAETRLYHDRGMSGENPFYDPQTGRAVRGKIKVIKDMGGNLFAGNNPWSTGGGGGGPVEMKNGTVKFFNEAKGFGFIKAEDGQDAKHYITIPHDVASKHYITIPHDVANKHYITIPHDLR